MIRTSAFEVGQRFVGIKEIPGLMDNPMILAMLRLAADGDYDSWPEHDEVPWCSAFVNYVCHLLRLPRSKSLRARSWLRVGWQIPLSKARVGCDLVILKRGKGEQPGPEVINAPGHVGFYAGHDEKYVHLLGGNQGNTVSVQAYPVSRILGVRRIL